MNGPPSQFEYYSTNIVDFADNNLGSLVKILLDRRQSERLLLDCGFLSRAQLGRNSKAQKKSALAFKSTPVDAYIAQLVRSQCFLTSAGREQVERALLSEPELPIKRRKEVG